MRDIAITVLVFGLLPFILRNPYYGVLMWSWLSYMNPHKLAWGFAYDMPFAQIVAIVLLVSLLMSPEKKTIPHNSLVVIWALFFAWNILCTFTAFYPDTAFNILDNVLKIQVITFVTLIMMKDFQRINMLIWVIVFSIGFYSVKGGAFTLMTGGAFHVYGPVGSYIFENNTLAVGVLMIVPLMFYLYKFPPHKLVKRIMPLCIFMSMVSVVGSQSRGALLAIGAVGGYFWLQSKNKILTTIVFVFLAFFGYLFMPQEWHDRMSTITEYKEDSSAMERIHAWEYSINLANDRIMGGGFGNWSLENYAKYSPESKRAFVAHSIYFGVLGESGWIGLGLFLLVLMLVWRQLGEIIRKTKNNPDRRDFHLLARMLRVSMLAFMSGGAFLSLAYFDLAWHIMAITVALRHIVREDVTHSAVVRVEKKTRARLGRASGRSKLAVK